jgi:hypothetical protein
LRRFHRSHGRKPVRQGRTAGLSMGMSRARHIR